MMAKQGCDPHIFFGKTHPKILDGILERLSQDDLLNLSHSDTEAQVILAKAERKKKKATLRKIFTSKRRPSKQEKPDLVFAGSGDRVSIVKGGKAILVKEGKREGPEHCLRLYPVTDQGNSNVPSHTAVIPKMICGKSITPQNPYQYQVNDEIIVNIWSDPLTACNLQCHDHNASHATHSSDKANQSGKQNQLWKRVPV